MIDKECPKCKWENMEYIVVANNKVLRRCRWCGTIQYYGSDYSEAGRLPHCHIWKEFTTPPPALSTILIVYPNNRVILAAKIHPGATWEPEIRAGVKWREVAFLPEW